MKLIISLSIFLAAQFSFGFDQTHSEWDAFLKEHVVELKNGAVTQVDYGKAKQNIAKLKNYISQTAAVTQSEFKSWPKNQRLAFLINTYNANTVDLILTKYPDIKSIKDLGGFLSSPWKKDFFKLFGKERHLDEIEHEMIRKGDYKDPRIHFAVNCASIGCPALRKEAFVGDKLDVQLEDSLTKFLTDKDRNRYNSQKNTIEASKIFSWYKEDFSKGWLGFNSLKEFFAKYANLLTDDKTAQEKIKSKKVEVDHLDYDWNLNKVK